MKEFSGKYTRRFNFKIENRQWPDKHIERAPIWCSVDLRDGNQALAIPMNVDEKMKLYNTLLNVGFKEIEVGFPAASDTEFKFLRKLIDENLIPEGVTVQVLTQAREHLIKKTFEALKGCKSAIVHLYNSTSALQRKVTFNMSREDIIDIARQGARLVRAMADEAEANGTHIRLEYSPESFSDTELDFALEICEVVKEIWKPTPENKIIINLPETVQYNPPNIYADQIEWMSTHISDRDCVEISLHAHNDRGTGVAATELALTAGADRVEGTLFGNGERTGNLDIVTVALNMHAEGIESGLDFSNLPEVKRVYEECTRMQVPPRHPYAGDLVFTAFSGSHQDAIKKGMDLRRKNNINSWEVPYLLIDPTDVGCSYEAIIRINSQSGKGGVAYVLSDKFHLELPKAMHQQVGDFVNSEADKLGKELVIEDVNFDSIIGAVKSGKADAGAAGITITAERAEEVDFSIPYSSTEQYLILAADNAEITNLDGLNGKKIGVQQGTTSDFLVAELIAAATLTDATLTPYDTPSLAAAALGTKIDAVVTDKLTAEVIVASSNGAYKTFKLTKADGSDVAEVEQYGIAVGKGNAELIAVINEVLTELLANGSVAQWEQQYNDIYSAIE